MKYDFEKVEDNKIVLYLHTRYSWQLEELDWDEEYIHDYGGTIEEDMVTVDTAWGEVEITADNPFFDDKNAYHLAG